MSTKLNFKVECKAGRLFRYAERFIGTSVLTTSRHKFVFFFFGNAIKGLWSFSAIKAGRGLSDKAKHLQ